MSDERVVAGLQQAERRTASEVLRRGYSDEEVSRIYELGRLCLENGDVKKAEAVLTGVTQIAPDYAPAWLAMSYVQLLGKNQDAAFQAARQAYKADPNSVEAMLFLISCLLSHHDYNTAGTYLGEVAERIESGAVSHPNVVRFYRTQLARYQSRRGH